MTRSHAGSAAASVPGTGRKVVTLDPIDHELVRLLQIDGRATFQELSESVGLSGESTRLRVARLERTGVVRIVASVAPQLLGYSSSAMVGVNVGAAARSVAQRLAQLPSTSFVVCTGGKFDLLAEIDCRDDAELLDVLDEVREIPGVVRCESFMYLSVAKYAYRQSVFLAGSDVKAGTDGGAAAAPVVLDEVDHSLIEALREDGRASYSALAKKAGVPYSSTRRKVLQLVESGVLHINTLLGDAAPYRYVQASIGIRTTGRPGRVAVELQQHPEVGMILLTAGSHDLIIEVTCEDKQALLAFVEDTLGSTEGVVSSESYVYLDIEKLPFSWGAMH
ncbi:DNA-binding transcriptional regulator, Lrp family [Arthrobacter sp. cf158]|uniref:Lrp/AsnC family transcriptional regulator n=1 Tax=Arthrobacter sp. cf158 TaxID=1761744 RepID=UPI000897FF11|nr:Lrp/AsnC family transcriptional regulator [Arthrobacter sp. cf158]SDW91426.1 DNA-binding transcriptional regulator, Lrp family [Arthrobacter sp. cf158]